MPKPDEQSEKAGQKDRHIQLIAGQHDGVRVALLRRAAVVCQVVAHLADELARAVRPGFERVDDLLGRLVADAKLFFIDEGVVDAVDHELAQGRRRRAVLVLVAGDVVLEAEGFEKVLVDDVGAGGDDGIDHVVADEVDDDLLQPGRDERTGEAENDAALGIAQHHVVDGGGAGKVTRAIGHLGHGVDKRHDVVLGDIDVLDGVLEKFLFCGHVKG